MRCRCTCYSDVVRKVTYHVEIKNERTGKIKAFDHTVTLNPRDGSQWLQICGWGSDSGTSYAPGTHTYTLYYKNREMGRGRFEVVKSPKQRGWIEPWHWCFIFTIPMKKCNNGLLMIAHCTSTREKSLNRNLSKPIHTKGY